MAKTQEAKDTNKQENQINDNQIDLKETQDTQTPPSRQAGFNQAQSSENTSSGEDRNRQNQGLSRRREESPGMSPFGIVSRFSQEMDRLFEDFGGLGSGLMPSNLADSFASTWSPQTEVFKRDGDLVIQTDLPGMSKDDIDVTIEDEQITIRGERRNENEQTGEGFYHTERSYGSFYRSFPIPQNVNADEAKANFKNGVLEISMPLPEDTKQKGRKIEISDDNS